MYIFFNSRDELQRIEVSKIVYFEADGNYTDVVMVNKLRAKVNMNLGDMERAIAAQIGDDAKIFMRIGKRFIINMQFVYNINVLKQQLILSDYDHFAFQVSISKDALKKMLKTDDIHPPKSVISVHFFCLTCLMALQI